MNCLNFYIQIDLIRTSIQLNAQLGLLISHSTTRLKECLAINTNKHRGKVTQAKKRTAAKPKRVHTHTLLGFKGGGAFMHLYALITDNESECLNQHFNRPALTQYY